MQVKNSENSEFGADDLLIDLRWIYSMIVREGNIFRFIPFQH